MAENINDIEILIAGVISGNAGPDEITRLEAWKTESDDNLKIYLDTLKAWDKCIGWIPEDEIKLDRIKILFETDRELQAKLKRIRRRVFLYKIAAVLAFPIAVASTLYFIQDQKSEKQTASVLTVTAPRGHISKCVLPDGTDVWVNTGSTITYNTGSFTQAEREIQLEGEAYFQVKHDEKNPFRVITSAADIKVTGTAFNVKAYTGSGTFETVLTDGSIEMELKTMISQTIDLVPGERALFDLQNKKITINRVDTEMYSSWRNGEIIFKDATLRDLVTELERIYDITFHFRNENLPEYRFRGMFSYNNNLIDALEKIKKTAGINYYIENKEVWLSK